MTPAVSALHSEDISSQGCHTLVLIVSPRSPDGFAAIPARHVE
jgi:hypothetical protein